MIRQLTDSDDLFHAAAAQVCRIGQLSFEHIGAFSSGVVGGSTPRGLYQLLAPQPPMLQPTRLEEGRVLLGRRARGRRPIIPIRTTGMAKELMLDKLGVPAERMHRIKAELGTDAAARDYEDRD